MNSRGVPRYLRHQQNIVRRVAVVGQPIFQLRQPAATAAYTYQPQLIANTPPAPPQQLVAAQPPQPLVSYAARPQLAVYPNPPSMLVT